MKLGRVNLRRSLLAAALSVLAQFAYADAEQANAQYVATEYAAAWGPSIGSTAPMLSALDQHGAKQNLASLKGSDGLLFVFNRSVDW